MYDLCECDSLLELIRLKLWIYSNILVSTNQLFNIILIWVYFINEERGERKKEREKERHRIWLRERLTEERHSYSIYYEVSAEHFSSEGGKVLYENTPLCGGVIQYVFNSGLCWGCPNVPRNDFHVNIRKYGSRYGLN